MLRPIASSSSSSSASSSSSEEEFDSLLVGHRYSDGRRLGLSIDTRPCLTRIFGAFCLIGTVTVLALNILKDYGNSWNTFISLGVGLLFQACIQALFVRSDSRGRLTLAGKVIEYEKDVLVKYAAAFFICFTQVYLNVPQTRWFVRLTYGMFGALLGAQISTIVDNVLHWRVEHDRTREVELLDEQATPQYLRLLAGNYPFSRRFIEVVKVALGVGGIVTGYYVKGASIALKLGAILLGHSLGTTVHELSHTWRHRLEREYQNSLPIHTESEYASPGMNMPTSLKVLILLEKVEQIIGTLLPGFIIAFNTPYTDALAGAGMGMVRQIDFFRFTQTPYSELGELERREPREQTYYELAFDVAKWAFAVLAVGGFLGYGIYDGIANGPAANAYALGTFAVVLYSSYALTRYIDSRELPNNRFTNTLFFYTNFSIAAPIIYIAITQVLKIGDYALDNYAAYKIALSCLGWASLAWAFGTQAGARATNRNVPYPATVDPLIILYTSWFVGLFLSQK